MINGLIEGLLLALVAQNAPAVDAFTAGTACFDQLDFRCAIELLGAAARETPPGDQDRLLQIYRKLAESHLALGRREDAVAAFLQLLHLSPRFEIDGTGTSPKILDALQEARERLRQEQQALAEKKAPPPPPEPWMEVGLSAGPELLVGKDADLLEAGAAIEVEASFVLSGPWRAGGGMRYAFHDLSKEASTVHLGGGWAALGAALRLGPVCTQLLLGAGLARFWIPDAEGQIGLLLPVRLSAGVAVSGDLHLGLLVAPGWLITLDGDPQTSFTLTVGGRIAMVF